MHMYWHTHTNHNVMVSKFSCHRRQACIYFIKEYLNFAEFLEDLKILRISL